MLNIPDTHIDLLKDENRVFAFIATIMKDGSPQLTPVWFNFEKDHIFVNTTKGRTKYNNLINRPAVAIVLMSLDNPYHYLQIRGKVVDSTEEGAAEHINFLSQKYEGVDWNLTAGQVRVKFQIKPEKIIPYSW